MHAGAIHQLPLTRPVQCCPPRRTSEPQFRFQATIVPFRVYGSHMITIAMDTARLREVCERYGVARLEVFGSVSRGEDGPVQGPTGRFTIWRTSWPQSSAARST